MSDVVTITCPGCEATYRVPDPAPKKKSDCKKCGCILVLPKLIDEARARGAVKKKAATVMATSEPSSKSSETSTAKSASSAPKKRGRAAPVVKRRGAKTADTDEPPARGRRGRRGKNVVAKNSAARRTRAGAAVDVDDDAIGDRRAKRRSAGKRQDNMLMFASIGAVVVIGAIAAFFFLNRDKDDGETDNTKTELGDATSKQDADLGDGLGSLDGDETNGVDPDSMAGSGATDGDTNDIETPVPTEKPKRKPKVKKWDREKYQSRFDPVANTTPEEEEAIKQHTEVLKDLNATRTLSRAKRALVDLREKAVPYLINSLMELDPTDQDDSKRGHQFVLTLADVTERERSSYDTWWQADDWPDPEGEDGKNGLAARRLSRCEWFDWWSRVGKSWKYVPPKEEGF